MTQSTADSVPEPNHRAAQIESVADGARVSDMRQVPRRLVTLTQ